MGRCWWIGANARCTESTFTIIPVEAEPRLMGDDSLSNDGCWRDTRSDRRRRRIHGHWDCVMEGDRQTLFLPDARFERGKDIGGR